MSYFVEPNSHSINKAKDKLNLSNHARESNLKVTTCIYTSDYAKNILI